MIKDYLEKMAEFIKNAKMMKEFYYNSIEEFVLKNGQEFKSQPLTEEEKKIVQELIKKEFIDCKVRQCYMNSQKLALASNKIQYVEGFAYGVIPINHSWNLINGKVIDLTWSNGDLLNKDKRKWKTRKEDIILGEFTNEEYFGVIIPIKLIRKKIIKDGVWDSIIDDWENRYPLLRKPWVKSWE